MDLSALLSSATFRIARDTLHATDSLTVQHQCAATGIAAPTGSEMARGRWLADRLGELGLEPQCDEVGNVFATAPAAEPSAPQLVIASHLDTVFAASTPLEIKCDGNRICAPGISDNARGLAGLLALARALHAAAWPCRVPITFLGSVGEEGAGDLRGVKHYIARRAPLTGKFIALDGAGAKRIITAGVGARRLRARFAGPGGHSWSDWGTPNAINASGRAIAALVGMELPGEPRTTLSAGRIAGGTSINAIPAEAWVELDLRSEQREPLLELEQRVRAALAAAAAAESNDRGAIACDIELFGDRPAGHTAPDDELVRAAIAATRAVQIVPELTSSSTDANVPMAAGIPAIALGAGGDAGGTHTLHEWYDNAGGVTGLERALLVVLQSAGWDVETVRR